MKTETTCPIRYRVPRPSDAGRDDVYALGRHGLQRDLLARSRGAVPRAPGRVGGALLAGLQRDLLARSRGAVPRAPGRVGGALLAGLQRDLLARSRGAVSRAKGRAGPCVPRWRRSARGPRRRSRTCEGTRAPRGPSPAVGRRASAKLFDGGRVGRPVSFAGTSSRVACGRSTRGRARRAGRARRRGPRWEARAPLGVRTCSRSPTRDPCSSSLVRSSTRAARARAQKGKGALEGTLSPTFRRFRDGSMGVWLATRVAKGGERWQQLFPPIRGNRSVSPCRREPDREGRSCPFDRLGGGMPHSRY